MSAGLQRRIEFEPQLVELLNAVCVTLESAEDFYRVEVERLRRGARTTAFVPLLATKRLHEDVRRRLRSQRLGPRPEIAEPAAPPLREPDNVTNSEPIEARASEIGATWSRLELEEFERALTVGELTRQDGARCREILALLKASREDAKRFARFGHEEQRLVIQLVDRFDGFC